MNHQYWLTRNAKKIQRKFNAKEDENIVHSDNELDSKLELFKSINESTSNLSNIVEKYRDVLASLANETANLGQFLRDCGKNSASSNLILGNTGKVINFLSQQNCTAMSSLTRTLQELNTFKRAVSDSKETIINMEKERTEYRAALTLMRNCSDYLDPDSGRGLEKFRTSQKYVKFAKQKFDKYSLACLQKIDLLSAARCNLFSYSLAAYQSNWITVSEKNLEVLEAHLTLIKNEPKKKHNFGILKDLAQEIENSSSNIATSEPVTLIDTDQRLFFGEEFSDGGPTVKKNQGENNEMHSEDKNKNKNDAQSTKDDKLIDHEAFDEFFSSNILLPSQLLMDDSLIYSNDKLESDLLAPCQISNETQSPTENKESSNNNSSNRNPSKRTTDVSKWFHLFQNLDPLNQQNEVNDANENMHAA